MSSFQRLILTLFAAFTSLAACAQSNTLPGQVANELTGKWCYYNLANGDEGKVTDTCVTLNSDGTYEFNIESLVLSKVGALFKGSASGQTDYGKWSVENNVLHYDSQTAGKGSFRFVKQNQPGDSKTPMIVLNGISFLPATPRDPW